MTVGGCCLLLASLRGSATRRMSHHCQPASTKQQERPKTYLEPLKQLQEKPPSQVIFTSQAETGAVVLGGLWQHRCVSV